MRYLHRKIFISFLIVHVIAIITIGITSYYLYSRNIQNKLYDSIDLSLKLTEKNLIQRISDINKYVNYINAHKNIQLILREGDFTSFNYQYTRDIVDIKEVLDTYYYDFTSEIKGVLFVPSNGGYYVDNGYMDNFNTVLASTWYEKIIQSNGRIEWFGMADNPCRWENKQVIIVGKLVYDTKHIRDLKPLGAIFIFLDPSVFTSITMDEGEKINYLLYDKNMSPITIKGSSELPISIDYFTSEKGSFDQSSDGSKNIYSYTTLNKYGWKLIQYIPYDYFIQELNYINIITFSLFFTSIIVLSAIYYLLAKKMAKPIKTLLNAMKKVSNKNFDIRIDISSNDEIALIAECFNRKNHLLHSVAFRIPNRLILLDKSPDTVAIWDYEKPN